MRFKELADQIGIPAAEMDTRHKRPLNIFEVPLQSWEQFCVIKMLGDLAEMMDTGRVTVHFHETRHHRLHDFRRHGRCRIVVEIITLHFVIF